MCIRDRCPGSCQRWSALDESEPAFESQEIDSGPFLWQSELSRVQNQCVSQRTGKKDCSIAQGMRTELEKPFKAARCCVVFRCRYKWRKVGDEQELRSIISFDYNKLHSEASMLSLYLTPNLCPLLESTNYRITWDKSSSDSGVGKMKMKMKMRRRMKKNTCPHSTSVAAGN